MPADGPHRDGDAVVGEFEGDAPGRALLLAPQVLDPGDDLCCGGSGLAVRHVGAVEQIALTELAVAVHPFAGAGAGDPHLGSDVGDRTSQTSLDEPSTAPYGQRGVGVPHRRYPTRFRLVAGERRSTIAKSSDHCPGERSRGSSMPRSRWPASHYLTAFAGAPATRGKI